MRITEGLDWPAGYEAKQTKRAIDYNQLLVIKS